MSKRPLAKQPHSRPPPADGTPRKTSGEHAILPPPRAQTRGGISGEYRMTRPENERENEDDLELELSVVEREVPRSEARLCDTVRLAGERGEGVIHLVEGEVAWVETRGFGLQSFRARLIELGLLEQHELDLVLALCRSEKLNFAEMLVQLELVSNEDLIAVMRTHARDSMCAMLAMPEVSGVWSRGSLSFTGNLTVPIGDVLGRDELERWSQIVAHAGGSLRDRRRDERIPLNAIANVETLRGQVLMMAENVSSTGALLRTPCLLDVGSPVVVRMTIGVEKLELRGKVTRFRRCSISQPQAIGIAWNDDAIASSGLARALEDL